MTLRQLLSVAYQALCEHVQGQEKADEVLADLAAAYEPGAKAKPSKAEQDARRRLIASFEVGG